jgi:superfamily II DNA/RNA helicase
MREKETSELSPPPPPPLLEDDDRRERDERRQETKMELAYARGRRTTTTRMQEDLSEELVKPSKWINERTCEIVREMNVKKWTRVQVKAMERLKDGRDGLIAARTGSGKTLAFLMPSLIRLVSSTDGRGGGECCDGDDERGHFVRAIAILPTRELALQVFEKAKMIFETANGLKCSLLVGGTRSHEKDCEDLRKNKPVFVVGTPGRLLELKKMKALDLSKIEVQILDEIDRLLDGGFENDVLDVLRPPGACQTICATATARANLRRFLNKTLCVGYKEISSGAEEDDDDNNNNNNNKLGNLDDQIIVEIGGNVAHCSCAVAKGNSDNEVSANYAKAILSAFKGFVNASEDKINKTQCLCFVETKSLCDKIEVALQKEVVAMVRFDFFCLFVIFIGMLAYIYFEWFPLSFSVNEENTRTLFSHSSRMIS